MLITFVAGPYRDSRGAYYIRENIERAREVAVELWKLGFAVICPHMNTALMDGILPDEVWLEGGVKILRRAADFIVLIPGWRTSIGSVEERKVAEDSGIGIYCWPEQKRELEELAARDKKWEAIKFGLKEEPKHRFLRYDYRDG